MRIKALHAATSVCLVVLPGVVSRSEGAWMWTALDCPLGTVTTPKGVSGGKIVGSYLDASKKTHGFLYDNGAWSTIEPAGAIAGDATAICGNSIVGSYMYTIGSSHLIFMGDAYVYNGNTYESLGSALQGENASPTGIDGTTIVGNFISGINPEPPVQNPDFVTGNFVYNGITLASLNAPGSQATILYGISDSKIVGKYWTTAPGSRGFLYDSATQTWSDLRFQPTNERVTPYGIEGDRIVGSYSVAIVVPPGYVTYKNCGFYYDGSVWQSLSYPGAAATYARAISGNDIVGYYTDAGGVQHGFLLTVPEPVTISLLAVGGLLIARRRHA
jgi:hypothetical protein